MVQTAMSREPRKGSKPSTRRKPTPEQKALQGANQQSQQASADLFNQFAQFYKGFNPAQMTQQMQPQFTQQMQQAGDALYQEYMRRAQPEMEKQQVAARQSLVERGLDPRGEAYKDAMTQLAQQQNDMRLAAQSRAAQEATAYQQQLFQQAQAQSMLPAQIAGQFSGPMQQYQQYQQNLQLQREQLANQLRIAKMQARNRGGGGGGTNPAQMAYIEDVLKMIEAGNAQGQNPSEWNQGMQSFLSGLGSSLGKSYGSQ